MEEEAGTESSKEEEVMARGADGGGATGVRGQTDRRGLSGCVCEWIQMEEMRE